MPVSLSQQALEQRGHRAVNIDLQTDEPGSYVDDYGRLAASQVGSPGDIVVVTHSGPS